MNMATIIIIVIFIFVIIIVTRGERSNDYSPSDNSHLEKLREPIDILREKLKILIPEARFHYRRIMGKESKMPREIRIRSQKLKDSVGTYHPPQYDYGLETYVQHGLITIDKDSLKDLKYAESILKHELIHALFNQTDHKESHHRSFQIIATAMKIPPKYQD